MKTNDIALYFDRDLSWLSFNYRVLNEAQKEEVPLFERIKFLAIFSSNLDEFFRVRVASLKGFIKLGKKKFSKDSRYTSENLLNKILETVLAQQEEFGRIFRDQILPGLKKNKIVLYQEEELDEVHLAEIKSYFRNKVMGTLQPVIFTQSGQCPFLNNRALYFLVTLRHRKQEITQPMYALLNIPTDQLPRFYRLSERNDTHYFIFLDDVIRHNLHTLFPGYTISSCHSIKINRDEDLHIEDEFSGDLIEKIKKQLTKRKMGFATRFLYDAAMPAEALDLMKRVFQQEEVEAVAGARYHNYFDLMQLPNPYAPLLEFTQQIPLKVPLLEQTDSLFEVIARQDYLLHFPYHSYDYVLRFFNEAAIDPDVTEIKLTVYRLAANSFIANALISAARNGKKVTVFVEVKARFDETNNLKWAEAMKNEGVKIIYSIPGLKVHAKVALVIRKKGNKKENFAYLGTGNFNEGTAKIYTDQGLFTASKQLCKDLGKVFRYLSKKKEVRDLRYLLVSQFNILQGFDELIEREISHAQAGKKAGILLKLNALEDEKMIDKLYRAAGEGVKIEIIVRGICCLVPLYQENITVIRIVDRYLEHSRAYVFTNNGETEVFLGSADWMTRNLHHRIEVVFPLLDTALKNEMLQILEMQLKDNVNAVYLDENQNNIPKTSNDGASHHSQLEIYRWLKNKNQGLE